MVTYRLTEPGLVTQAMKNAAPDSMTTKGVEVTNNWMSGKFTKEIGRNLTESGNLVNQGSSVYRVSPEVINHDKELYGF